jgi:hypothetical protein
MALLYLIGLIVENFRRTFEKVVNMAMPPGEERAIPKVSHMCFHGGPDNGEHIAPWTFNAACYIGRDA